MYSISYQKALRQQLPKSKKFYGNSENLTPKTEELELNINKNNLHKFIAGRSFLLPHSRQHVCRKPT
jgi:hypothetical protein